MAEHLDWCLSADGRAAAKSVAGRAAEQLQPAAEQLRDALITQFDDLPLPAAPKSAGPGLAWRIARGLIGKRPD